MLWEQYSSKIACVVRTSACISSVFFGLRLPTTVSSARRKGSSCTSCFEFGALLAGDQHTKAVARQIEHLFNSGDGAYGV